MITKFSELTYEKLISRLTVAGCLKKEAVQELMTCYGSHADRAVIVGVIAELRERSQVFISDDELKRLTTWANRLRGEIFFARRWLIVEGQSEYLLIHALAKQMGYDLDEHGVSVIDAVNNGYPAILRLSRGLLEFRGSRCWTAIKLEKTT